MVDSVDDVGEAVPALIGARVGGWVTAAGPVVGGRVVDNAAGDVVVGNVVVGGLVWPTPVDIVDSVRLELVVVTSAPSPQPGWGIQTQPSLKRLFDCDIHSRSLQVSRSMPWMQHSVFWKLLFRRF